MAEVPFELTGFEPISRIGGGGFGDVWLARQVNIDRQVAVKVGHAPIDDKTVQLRFERECIALGRLSGHPNIIDVFTAGQLDDGRPYLVLEYVSGGTLWQRLQRSELSDAELRRIGAQLAEALAAAHDTGVLHRDLKPENVLLRQSGDVVLGDFGIARLHDGANTTSHAITASVAYAAPEILSGKPASVASDLYGIGICLLAAVLRSVPFVQKTDESIHPIINRVLSDRPPDLRPHGVSETLNTAIHALLEKSPTKRPIAAADAKALLERAAAPPPPTAPPTPPTTPPTTVAPPLPAGEATHPVADVREQVRLSDPNATQRPSTPLPDAPAARSTGNETRIAHGGPPGPAPSPHPATRVSGPLAPTPSPPPTAGPPATTAPPAPGIPDPRHPTPGPPGHAHRPAPAPTGFGPGGLPPSNQRPGPFQPHHHTATGGQPIQPGQPRRSDRLRVFGAAFGATLLIGGLLVFVISRIAGGGSTSSTVTTVTASETDQAGASDVTDGTDGVTGSEPESASPTDLGDLGPDDGDDELAPLVLPLGVEDLGLGEPALTEPDTDGPAVPQFCDNTPVTTGLVEWEGETYSDPAGFPVVFQEIVRFDTAAQASAYMASYVATVDCSEWIIPGDDGGPDVIVRPEVVAEPATTHGDATEEIAFEAEADFLTLVARAALVRKNSDVYLMSVTSILTSDVAELDRLLALAVDRLGY